MPSKTLIASGELAHEIRQGYELGVTAGEPQIDFGAIIRRKRAVIKDFADYRIAGIDTFPTFLGEAEFTSPSQLRVGEALLEAPKFIIATGSSIAPPALSGLRAAGFIDSDEALDLDVPPKSLVVLGGGYVATELGQFYSRIGVPVTMVLRAPHLLSGEDDDVGDALTEYLRAEGIRIETRARMTHASVLPDGMKAVHFERDGADHVVSAHEIFYALGRTPNIAGLGLEAIGVEAHAMTGIRTDATMRTNNPNVFAVGDVTGDYLLVHVAIQQGELAARNAVADAHERIDYRLSRAHAVFSDPQVAVAGMTEKELTADGIPYLSASYPFDDLGKAISIGKTKGFVKMLAAPQDGRILGVAILGSQASDMIHIPIAAMAFNASVFDYLKIPHLHPTMAEILTYPAEELALAIEAAGRRPAPAIAS
jgi:pyruvate/2-oxoglutarate dehydrogenase complex dihydrolipoamide dehydrogenase (E3) component